MSGPLALWSTRNVPETAIVAGYHVGLILFRFPFTTVSRSVSHSSHRRRWLFHHLLYCLALSSCSGGVLCWLPAPTPTSLPVSWRHFRMVSVWSWLLGVYLWSLWRVIHMIPYELLITPVHVFVFPRHPFFRVQGSLLGASVATCSRGHSRQTLSPPRTRRYPCTRPPFETSATSKACSSRELS